MSDLRQAASFALSTLQGWSGHGHWRWPESALAQAKQNTAEAIPLLEAALAEPEPEGPTDEELMKLAREWNSGYESIELEFIADYARAVLARWGKYTIPLLTFNMTNYRQLCIELINELHGYKVAHPQHDTELIERARVALAEPEPEGPTDEELLKLTEDWPCTTGERHDLSGCPEVPLFSVFEDELIDFARAVLARWGK